MFLRVASEIPVYGWSQPFAWYLLPVSAPAELTAVALFVFNLLATFTRLPAHLKLRSAA